MVINEVGYNLLGRLRQKNCKTSLGYMVRLSVKVRVSEREERARKKERREGEGNS